MPPQRQPCAQVFRERTMYLGTQNRVTTDDEYRQFAQLGVKHVNADPEGNPHDWTLDVLKRHRDRLEGFGLVLDMVQLPLESLPIEKQTSPDILSKGPNRDRQIDSICRLIENVAKPPASPRSNTTSTSSAFRARSSRPVAAARATPPSAGTRWIRPRRPASPACCQRTRTGSASTTSSSASYRSPRPARCASPAIRTIPIRRPAIAASRACSARSKG